MFLHLCLKIGIIKGADFKYQGEFTVSQRNVYLKIKIDNIIVILLWLGVFIIDPIPDSFKLLLRIFVVAMSMFYILSNLTYIFKVKFIPIYLYAFIAICSSCYNYRNDLGSMIRNILYWILIVEIFIIFNRVIKKQGILEFSKYCLHFFALYLIPAVYSTLSNGIIDFGGENMYILGNKFNMTYFYFFALTFLGILCRNKNSLYVKFKLIFWLFYIATIALVMRMTCYTGIAMLIVVFVLLLLNEFRAKQIQSKKSIGFVRILKNPYFIVMMIVSSGLAMIIINSVIQLNFVENILERIGKTGTINSRLIIYTYLKDIVERHPLLGYGNDTRIVAETIAGNAQNGLLNIIIQFGFIGVVAFLIVCKVVFTTSKENIFFEQRWFMYWIYAYIVAGTIEVTFGMYFMSLLAICQGAWSYAIIERKVE